MYPQKMAGLFLFTLLFLVDAGDSIFYKGSESHLSDVNLERFYLMEENVMSNADALIRKDLFGAEEEETEEEHEKHSMNMTQIERVLERAKDLHRDVGSDLWNFLGHPVNILHLFSRLNNEWKKGLDLLLNSTPCKLWKISAMKHFLRYLRETTPNDEETKMVVNHLIRMQRILGNPTHEVANGILGNIKALEPLSVNQQFFIGKVLYEREELEMALPWLELVTDWLKTASKEQRATIGFSKRNLYNMMSTGYYLNGQIDNAVNITERLLDLDPSNQNVLHNLNFFLMKQMTGQIDKQAEREKAPTPRGRNKKLRLEKICAGNVLKLSRKYCVLEPVHGSIGWFVYKKEILRHKPAIAIYHDVITPFTMKRLMEYSHEKLINKAWISAGYFLTPQMSIELEYPQLPRGSIRYATQKLGNTFANLPGPNGSLLMGWGQMQVLNIGRTGVKFADYQRDLYLQKIGMDNRVGAMFAFLSEPSQGGEIVLKTRKIMAPAPKGSILVYRTTQTRLHSLCPALGGSQWVVVQPFYERSPHW